MNNEDIILFSSDEFRKISRNESPIDDEFDTFDNPAVRCPCTLLLDVSGSMQGAPIEELNAGVRLFFDELYRDEVARFSVEVAVVVFGGETARMAMPFTSLAATEQVLPPVFEAHGNTPMGQAIEIGIDLLARRKSEYQSAGLNYYQPWMVLLSDGRPTDSWEYAAGIVRDLASQRKLIFLGVGVGPRVDMEILARICPANRPPKRLAGLRFRQFFEWLSQSLGDVSRSTPGKGVPLPSTRGWDEVEA